MPLTEALIELLYLTGFLFIDHQAAVHVIIAGGRRGAAVIIAVFGPGDAAHGESLCDLVLFQLGED